MSTYIFPAQNAARSLHAGLMAEKLIFLNPLLAGEVPTLEACYEIVQAIVDEQINGRMIWATLDQELIDKVIAKHLEHWDEPRYHGAVRHLYDNVVDPIYLQICEWISVVIPGKTWKVWYLRKVGRDLALEEGMDYRIMDWTRRKERGEFEGHE